MKNIMKYSLSISLILALNACGGISRSVTETDTNNKSSHTTVDKVDKSTASNEQIHNTPPNTSIPSITKDKNTLIPVDKVDNSITNRRILNVKKNITTNDVIKNTPPKAPNHSSRGDNVIFVSTCKELRSAIANVKAGQTIYLKSGTKLTVTDNGLTLENKKGTKSKKIVITTSPTNPAIIDGGNPNKKYSYGLIIKNSDWLEVSNITIQNMKLWGIHAGWDTGTKNAIRGVVNSEFLNLHIKNTGSAAIRIGSNSAFVKIIGCKIHGRFKGSTENKEWNEGIYIGYGNNRFSNPNVDYTHDITIQYCDISDRYADGIDLKVGSYNIIVQYNRIHDTVVPSQGAITVLLRGGKKDKLGSRNANVLVDSNLIWNIRKDVGTTYDGAGIIVASGNTTVSNNIIWDIDPVASPIEIYYSFHPKQTQLTIKNNILWGEGEAIENVGDPYRATNNSTAPTINASGNTLSAPYQGSNKVISIEKLKALINKKAPTKNKRGTI